jgi:regulator of replication initiation timing
MDDEKESLARLHERIEHLLDRMEKLEAAMAKMVEINQKIQLERAREHGYFAGAAALAAMLGGLIAKFL